MESQTYEDKKRGMIALVVGAILILVGFVLVITDVIVYVGEWPNERPVYLAGIGYPLFIIGIFSALTGLYFYLAGPRASTSEDTDGHGKEFE